MEEYPAFKKKEILPFVEDIVPSEARETHTDED
jgi:hypothetical protein